MTDQQRESFEKWFFSIYRFHRKLNEAEKFRERRLRDYHSALEGYQAALAEQSEPSPCGIDGHRWQDWVPGLVVFSEIDVVDEVESRDGHCRLCAARDAGKALAQAETHSRYAAALGAAVEHLGIGVGYDNKRLEEFAVKFVKSITAIAQAATVERCAVRVEDFAVDDYLFKGDVPTALRALDPDHGKWLAEHDRQVQLKEIEKILEIFNGHDGVPNLYRGIERLLREAVHRDGGARLAYQTIRKGE